MLEVINASKTFAKGTPNEHKALDHLNLSLKEGEFVTILGSNGAGKSTLFNAICGNFLLDEGSVILDGKNISYLPEHQRSASIGRLFQDPMKGTAPNLTIEENLAIAYYKNKSRGLSPGITSKDREVFREKLSMLEMGLEDKMTQKVKLLSGGQRQALTLFMAAITEPKLLLLDEPSMGLSPILVDEVFEIIKDFRKDGTTVLLVEQNASKSLAISDRAYVLELGQIVLSGTGAELAASEEVKKAYLGG